MKLDPPLDKSEVKKEIGRFVQDTTLIEHYTDAVMLLTDETGARNAFKKLDGDLEKLAQSHVIREGGVVDMRNQLLPPNSKSRRTLSFRKPLIELEHTVLGLEDRGRIFTGGVPETTFKLMVNGGEVWKDSVGEGHGEYTHRLQWLAIGYGLKLGTEAAKQLYTQSVAEPKGYQYKGHDGLPRRTTLLWDFVVDCFPGTPATLETIISNSFRNPGFTTQYLLQDSTNNTPFITSYLKSSFSKLQLYVKAVEEATKKKADGLALDSYRRARIEQKYGVKLKPDHVVFTPGPKGEHQVIDEAGKEFIFKDARL